MGLELDTTVGFPRRRESSRNRFEEPDFSARGRPGPPHPEMIVGILQVELTIDAARSLKDKRRVVSSAKARLHREHQVSVAEVGSLDDMRVAMLGITMASNNVAHCQSTLDRILNKLQTQKDCHVSDHQTQILTGQ